MKKEELEEEIKRLKEVINKTKTDELLLRKQHREFRKMAEEAGSEIAAWKHKAIRLEEENNKLKAR